MFRVLKIYTALHIAGVAFVAHTQRRHAEARRNGERGLEAIQVAILAALSIAVAGLVVVAIRAAVNNRTTQIK